MTSVMQRPTAVGLTILGADVYLPSESEPAARFTSHSAAFEAVCRLHNPAWQPIGASHTTKKDSEQLVVLRRRMQPLQTI
jgi:hypothetical protein